MSHDLVESVEKSILSRRLFARGERVLVAVSGGLDSMVLLQVLHTLSVAHRWRVQVAHFNHQLRGTDSDADETLVREATKKLGLVFFSGRANMTAFAQRRKVSVEMAARELRHRFLSRTAKRLRVRTIALAHHADDQVELFFLRLLRGAGGEGLSGMRWSSPSPYAPGVRLARPLLDVPKADLYRFAEEKRIAFREDATNGQTDFLRNRVRHKLLPLLKQKFQPNLVNVVLRTMEVVRAEADYVHRSAENWLARKNARPGYGRLPPGIQRRIIQVQLIRLGVVPDFDLVERLRDAVRQPVSVGWDWSVYRDSHGRILEKRNSKRDFIGDHLALGLTEKRGQTGFGGLRFRWKIGSRKRPGKVVPGFEAGVEHFDADKIGSRVVLRHWRPGDRFRPIGMKASVKLQDLFVNQKIPQALRRRLIVGEIANGELFWVERLRIGELFKLDNATIRRLEWRWEGRESVVAGPMASC